MACLATANSQPAPQLMTPWVCSALGSAPSEEFASPPISSFSSCSAAP